MFFESLNTAGRAMPSFKAFVALFAFAMVSILTGCVTTVAVEDIPEDLTPAKFFQIAQEYVDQEQYQAALTYLLVFKSRFADDLVGNLEAEYLIAQIDYKEGNLGEARQKFVTLLTRYNAPDAAQLPQWIKILSARLITRIDEIDPTAKDDTATETDTQGTTAVE